jgi:hypothetical protein
VVICDYDLLATIPLEKWECDALPTLEAAPALRILHAAAARPKYMFPGPLNTAPRTVEPS